MMDSKLPNYELSTREERAESTSHRFTRLDQPRSSLNRGPVAKAIDRHGPQEQSVEINKPASDAAASAAIREVDQRVRKARASRLEHPRPSDIHNPNVYQLDNQSPKKQYAPCYVSCVAYLSWIILIITFPVSIFFCIKIIKQYERAVIFRLGRLKQGGEKRPGMIFILPCIDVYHRVDMRTMSFDVPPQEVLTKDSVTIKVDAVVYYRIYDATMSVINVANVNSASSLLAQSMLRNILGTRNLISILAELDQVSIVMQEQLDEGTGPWGVTVERVEIKDVRLPNMLQRSMAAEAEAAREARAKVIAAEGEFKASRLIRDAAEVMSQVPSALQLRYLQTLHAISSDKSSTIVFPLPMDMLANFQRPAEQKQQRRDDKEH